MDDNKSFLKEYRWHLLIATALIIIGYLVIYLLFRGTGIIFVGVDLNKDDWLSFLGAYLSFTGTVAVALVASLQTRYHSKRDERRRILERSKQIQPIFSVNIVSIDTQIDGTVEAANPYKNSQIQHRNVKISIENVNPYPITHLIVFEKYQAPLLKSNEVRYIQCAYSDSIDAQKWGERLGDRLIVLNESDFERNEQGIPLSFNINYEDIDGATMYQTFNLKNWEETFYYSLEGTYEA